MPVKSPPEPRFWAKVEYDPNGGCWLWSASLNAYGYGQFMPAPTGKPVAAHRYSYLLSGRTIPDGLVLDHLCSIRCCVNPDHLDPVTQTVNVRRAKGFRGGKSHCEKGHEFTPDNIYMVQAGKYLARRCRICVRINMHKQTAKKQALRAAMRLSK